MKSQRSILALKYTPVSIAGGVRRAVGGFLRYVQYRDQHLEPSDGRAVDAYLRYVAHRDRTSSAGRIFGRDGACTSADRRHFVEYVARSTRGLQPKWVTTRDGKREDRQRAVYTFILSPEDGRGLDLRRLASVAMRQLESDAGPGGIGPWFAAEHRNTAHHHVHIVLAARRETERGRFNTLVITRQRLQRMKDAIAIEIQSQRRREARIELAPRNAASLNTPLARFGRAHEQRHLSHLRWKASRTARQVGGRKPRPRRPNVARNSWNLLALQAIARRYSDRMERELERETSRAEREGWVR